MVFRKVRENGFYCFLGGCMATSLYFLSMSYSTTYERQITLHSLQNQEVLRLPNITSDERSIQIKLEQEFTCYNLPDYKFITQRGQYYVIYNFVQADRKFGCTESITLTSPGDYRFLDNVEPLVERWRGPVSIALYCPGYDFYTTMEAIAYVRHCQNSLIKEMVSFHLFFDLEHVPEAKMNISIQYTYNDHYNCSAPPPWEILTDDDTYKTNQSLLYPINVARNIAKLAARTYFVFPSDIELYPTRNFIEQFLVFVKENMNLFGANTRNAFVLPIFEVLENQDVPENKTMLKIMLKNKTAILFHQRMCAVCHKVIDGDKWILQNETKKLEIFSVGKRQGQYMVWEPFFVCTQNEPLWDERLTWEGQRNKMIQAYTMCIMDYNFYVLNNAFLIHKPGIKKEKVQLKRFNKEVTKSNKLSVLITEEIQKLYGRNEYCTMVYNTTLNKPKKKIG
ncbi:hypothetical protein GWI33_010770 [Rhynchophorus ferrugineus]|uniref:Uncharacterized protein n=1 Tax=Rhynchophorus ferrugineus TaxID=354439 RepID=A0A834IWW8_RHYFE|nr:hypothetical protein GWI33_010770 [Rhynchophorus ferrugineus]